MTEFKVLHPRKYKKAEVLSAISQWKRMKIDFSEQVSAKINFKVFGTAAEVLRGTLYTTDNVQIEVSKEFRPNKRKDAIEGWRPLGANAMTYWLQPGFFDDQDNIATPIWLTVCCFSYQEPRVIDVDSSRRLGFQIPTVSENLTLLGDIGYANTDVISYLAKLEKAMTKGLFKDPKVLNLTGLVFDVKGAKDPRASMVLDAVEKTEMTEDEKMFLFHLFNERIS